MTQGYQGQSGLLLELLRIAAKSGVFALKGGTAINFFFQDCPRLSVDIDLCYLPLSGRDEAFRDIRENMEAIKSEIEKFLPGAEVSISENCKVLVRNGGMTVNCLSEAELYASKFCAALQRQHPRDIFDVWLFFGRGGELTQEILDAFVVYLISHRKPAHEVLNPEIQDIRDLYHHRLRKCLGLVLIDQFDDKGKKINSHLREKFTLGILFPEWKQYKRLKNIVGFHKSAIGQPHFPTIVDIVLGSLRFSINAHTRKRRNSSFAT